MTNTQVPKHTPLSKWIRIIINDGKESSQEFMLDEKERLINKIKSPKRKIHPRIKNKYIGTKRAIFTKSNNNLKKGIPITTENKKQNKNELVFQTQDIFSFYREESRNDNTIDQNKNEDKNNMNIDIFNFLDQNNEQGDNQDNDQSDDYFYL